jgi:D-threo-aldose 1-dehydrogenase
MTTPVAAQRRVGQTDLEIPGFGFGAAHLGELYARIPEAEAQATLQAAWDGGVRLYDTAPWYGRGLSEHRVGGFLRARPRSEFKLITKVGRTLHRPADPSRFDRGPWTGGLNFEVRFVYGYAGIMRSYEQALQRLAVDTVDALVIHDLDAGFHGDALAGHQARLEADGVKALQELKAAGEIRAYGMGVNTREAFDTVASRVDLDFVLVAMPYTLLDQGSLHGGMARCLERGIGVIIGAPLASGILATGSAGAGMYGYAAAPEPVRAKVRGIEAVCATHGVALPAAALQFPLAHPAVAAIIPGAMRPAEVVANLAAVSAPIPQAFWSDLKAEGLLDPDAPTPTGA